MKIDHEISKVPIGNNKKDGGVIYKWFLNIYIDGRKFKLKDYTDNPKTKDVKKTLDLAKKCFEIFRLTAKEELCQE